MTNDEYQQLVDFLGRKFEEVDRRFDAGDDRFEAMEAKLAEHDDRFREIMAISAISTVSSKTWSRSIRRSWKAFAG